ncbi:unnamed protein product [Dimorphilus gyrociliatus]|uniref:CTCK domain-containing protein n=1 Tax=Dimorphilus gyrociliatus TaxID=2664684 RepID=A0A7I8VAU6_9ANNE|nr:unnamed protein product [Dimorphilus gyrociliatus]
MFTKRSALSVALILSSLITTLSFQLESSTRFCHLQSYRMSITDSTCENSRIISSSKCAGGCYSTTDILSENPRELFEECSCCVPSKLSHQMVELDCYPPYKKMFNITIIEKCSCRHCD